MEKRQSSQTIDKDELYREIVLSKAYGYLTRKANKMLILLADKAIEKNPDRDKNNRNDYKQTAMLNIFASWYLFNEDLYDNPFAYYTELFKRGTAQGKNLIFGKKGVDADYKVRVYSIDSLNDGNGMHNI